MKCPQAHDLLQTFLDNEPLPDPEAFELHLVGCVDCRERFAAARQLLAGLRRLPEPAPPAGTTEGILGRIWEDRRARWRLRKRYLALAAVAAGLLMAVIAGLSWPNGDGQPRVVVKLYQPMAGWFASPPGPAVPPPESSPPVAVPDEVAMPQPSLRESVADAGSAVASLTLRTADQTVGQGKLLLPDTAAGPLWTGPEPAPPEVQPATRSLREAGQGAASGLEPVTNSARRAIGLFLREIPATEPDSQ